VGFEVSKTWFYRLVAVAFVPLLIAGAAALLAMSALVYVPAGNEAVVLRWGQVDPARPTLKPGLRTKRPWPFETVRQFDVGGVHQLTLGVRGGEKGLDDDSKPLPPGQKRVKLWQKAHGIEGHAENDFLVPLRPVGNGGQSDKAAAPAAMAVAKIVVNVRYSIVDVYRFGFAVADGEAMLESLANREVLRFCSTTPFFDDQINDRQGAGGLEATADELGWQIQHAVDGVALGVKIVGVGFEAVHPPEAAAQAYEAVLAAESKAEAALHEARAQADRELASAAGSPLTARLLALAIRKADLLGQLQLCKDDPAFEKLIKGLLDGQVAQDIAVFGQEMAQADRMGRREDVALAQTMLEANVKFRDELKALLADRREGKALDLPALADRAARDAQERLGEAAGEAATRLADARAFRWRKEVAEGALAREFARESLPYAHKDVRSVYLTDRLCATWEKILPQAFKYVIGVDPNRIESRLNGTTITVLLDGEKVYDFTDDTYAAGRIRNPGTGFTGSGGPAALHVHVRHGVQRVDDREDVRQARPGP
ncbi:MAG: SPFH domain-containing protein, partial [Planctomycetota bacterium]|nr:SPFH domain-containing protein [Planctomycetota bacterium]